MSSSSYLHILLAVLLLLSTKGGLAKTLDSDDDGLPDDQDVDDDNDGIVDAGKASTILHL